MQSQPVEFLEWVEYDLTYAMDFYDSWLTNGADQFLHRFKEAAAQIGSNPEQFPQKYRSFAAPSSAGRILASTS